MSREDDDDTRVMCRALGEKHGFTRALGVAGVDSNERAARVLYAGCIESIDKRMDAIRIYCEYCCLHTHEQLSSGNPEGAVAALHGRILHARDEMQRCVLARECARRRVREDTEALPVGGCLKCKSHKSGTLVLCNNTQGIMDTLLGRDYGDGERGIAAAAEAALSELNAFVERATPLRRTCSEDACTACKYACTGNLFEDALSTLVNAGSATNTRVQDIAATLTRDECIEKQLEHARNISFVLQTYVPFVTQQIRRAALVSAPGT